MAAIARKIAAHEILGAHPTAVCVFSEWFKADDGYTEARLPRRFLTQRRPLEKALVDTLKQILVKHHASKQKLQNAAAIRAVLEKHGRRKTVEGLRLFPANSNTRKGNLAESLLCEYVDATGKAKTLIYRLRHNPNVDQSMKGDDLLAFDFDRNRFGLLVGEAKFRANPDGAVIVGICDALARSSRGGLPVSLQFVADRLFEGGKTGLAQKVLQCALRFAENKLVVDYAGFLLSNDSAGTYVEAHTPPVKFRCAMLSMAVSNPNAFVDACFDKLENEYGFDPH